MRIQRGSRKNRDVVEALSFVTRLSRTAELANQWFAVAEARDVFITSQRLPRCPSICTAIGLWHSRNILPQLVRPRPRGQVAELRGRFQPACVKVFAGCGHPMMRKQPEAVNRLIEEFLQYKAATQQTSAD